MTGKTAIAKGIEEIKKRIEKYRQIEALTDVDKASKEFHIKGLEESLWIFEQLLATEKKQLIDAHNKGHEDSLSSIGKLAFRTGEQYYNQTFGQ